MRYFVRFVGDRIVGWVTPLDPACPEVKQFASSLLDDPMATAMGAPCDEILEGFEHRHRAKCKRCQDYGAANIEAR